jgi:hypothetical protein
MFNKTKILAGLALIGLVSVAQASLVPTKLTLSDSITISYILTKDGNVIASGSGSTVAGTEYHTYSGDSIGYLSKAVQTKDGIKLTPGRLDTGIDLSFVPHNGEGDKITIDITGKNVELIKLDKVDKDGLTVQVPNKDIVAIKQRVVVKNGEEMTLGFGLETPGSKNYELIVTASK